MLFRPRMDYVHTPFFDTRQNCLTDASFHQQSFVDLHLQVSLFQLQQLPDARLYHASQALAYLSLELPPVHRHCRSV